MDYSIPNKDEILEALEQRFIKNNQGMYIDGWGCTFYENMLHFIRPPESPYISGKDIHDIRRTNFINEIKYHFPDKFDNSNVFNKCYITSNEMIELVNIMESLYIDGVAEFTSWNRICRNYFRK